ncbi:MAG: xseB [Pedobacter sp.]|jgi:exodeoxyribonuclease VII small subunit|nr:xseB [Pedobacter sp.]
MEDMTYEAAYKELEEITREIESESVSVDILAQKVSRASALIEYCQRKLRSTEDEVGKIVKQMDTSQPK